MLGKVTGQGVAEDYLRISRKFLQGSLRFLIRTAEIRCPRQHQNQSEAVPRIIRLGRHETLKMFYGFLILLRLLQQIGK